ncbi:MAG TPA: hypothetical protein PKB07_09980 [Flavilitoribacter sp.]|nr:hypothetical protein [Flavilitoribacter sp.]
MLKIFKRRKKKLPDRSLNDLKMKTNILFIDDRVFGNVDIIKNSGWKKTNQIKDADSLDQKEIRDAHILLIDIQGVGKKLKFREEGLGLIQALKERYPNKKVIVYSSEDQGKIEAFHPAINIADARLPKNADPYQYEVYIERYSREVFALSQCISRVREIMLNEFGTAITPEETTKNLEKIYAHGKYDGDSISRVFNIQNAGALADIISLFLSA